MVSQIYFSASSVIFCAPQELSVKSDQKKVQIINSLQLQHALDGTDDGVLVSLGRSDNTLVGSESPALAEVQSVAVDVSDLATGLADEKVTSSVVPDLLLVVLLDGQAKVNVTGTTGDGAVLSLRVQSHARGSDAEELSDGGVVALGGVRGLNTLTEDSLGDVGDGTHGDGLAGSESSAGQGTAGSALTENGGEQDTVGGGGGLLGTSAGIQAGGIIDGEVRGTDGTDLDVAVDHQAEADSVLAATEEALGTVDGVKSPDAARGATGAVAVINDLEHALLAGQRATEDVVALLIVQLDVLDQAPDLSAQVLVLAEGAGLLLGNNFVVGEVLADGGDDESLGAEVADGDGGLVILGDGTLSLLEEDLLSQETRPLDGQFGNVTFLLVGHDFDFGREVGEEEGEARAGFQSHAEGQNEGGADEQAGQYA